MIDLTLIYSIAYICSNANFGQDSYTNKNLIKVMESLISKNIWFVKIIQFLLQKQIIWK